MKQHKGIKRKVTGWLFTKREGYGFPSLRLPLIYRLTSILMEKLKFAYPWSKKWGVPQ